MDDLDTRPVALDDERRDFLRVGVARHDDVELRDRPVGAPELFAVQDVIAFGRPLDARRQISRIRADVRLGERERGDGAASEARKILLLLLLGAEELQRLRKPDRLVRGKEHGDVAVLARDELHRLGILAL